MQATITLEDFNVDHDEQATFTIALPEHGNAGTIVLDYGVVPHKITMTMTHPEMTVLMQSMALRVVVDMLDTHFDDSPEPKNEWAGDLLMYV